MTAQCHGRVAWNADACGREVRSEGDPERPAIHAIRDLETATTISGLIREICHAVLDRMTRRLLH